MPKTETFPEFLTLQTGGNIDIQAAKDGTKIPRFSMLAYTGGLMRIAGFELPVVVDLEGMQIESQSLPIRMDHDNAKGVGHSTQITIADGKITAAGVISRDTQWARDVANSGKSGFPWQASIGAQVINYEYVQPDQSVTVNGQTFEGECYVVNASSLKEISFVDSGADSNTEAEIYANQNHFSKGTQMPGTKTEPSSTVTTERKRVMEISAHCDEHRNLVGDDAATRIMHEAIESGTSVNDVDILLLKAATDTRELSNIRASRQQVSLSGEMSHPNYIGVPNSAQSSTQVLEASLLFKTGHHAAAEKNYSEQVLEAARKAPQHFMDIVEACLRLEGKSVHGMSKNEMVEASFSTFSLPGIMSNVAHKALLSAYNAAPGIHKRICKKRSVQNFKEHKLYRPDLLGGLDQLSPDGEIKHTTLKETDFAIQASTYAKMLRITRKDAIDDNLHVFDEIPAMFGRNARREQSDAFATLLLSGDGSFFSAGNGNYMEGAGSALSLTSLGIAIEAIRKQRDSEDRDLDLQPATLTVCPELERTALALLESEYIQHLGTQSPPEPTGNALRKSVELVVDSRLSNDAKFANASDAAWYLFADGESAPMNSCYLDGNENPKIDFFGLDHQANVLGMAWRIYLDWGFAFGDYRAAFKAKGDA